MRVTPTALPEVLVVELTAHEDARGFFMEVWREDGLTIYASTQFTTSVRDEAAEIFALPKSKVRVISDFTGGGFGAKYGIGNFGMLAVHLSRKAGVTCRPSSPSDLSRTPRKE